jgi:hypothetical protein
MHNSPTALARYRPRQVLVGSHKAGGCIGKLRTFLIRDCSPRLHEKLPCFLLNQNNQVAAGLKQGQHIRQSYVQCLQTRLRDILARPSPESLRSFNFDWSTNSTPAEADCPRQLAKQTPQSMMPQMS